MQNHQHFTVFNPNSQINNPQTFGLKWEKYAARELSERGWSVDVPPNFTAPYDLKIGRQGHAYHLHVEVKAARLTYRRVRSGYYRPRYQFDLSGGLNPQQIDFLYVLIAISATTGEIIPFIVPSYDLGQRRQVQITSDPDTYSGRLLAEYRHNWPIIDHVYEIRRRYQFARYGQLSLFNEVWQ